MDWLWPLYREYVTKETERTQPSDNKAQQFFFLQALSESTATLFVMEPVRDTVRFRGLGRWQLSDVPDLLTDPNAFIDERFGGGKFKINFHHFDNFICTHNFRTYSDEKWRDMQELHFD